MDFRFLILLNTLAKFKNEQNFLIYQRGISNSLTYNLIEELNYSTYNLSYFYYCFTYANRDNSLNEVIDLVEALDKEKKKEK